VNIGTVARTALKAVQNESLENKILVSKKIIKDLEDNPNEASFRLCRDLRGILKAVTRDTNATGDQITDAGSLLARNKKLDPRHEPKLTGEGEQSDDFVRRKRGYDFEAEHREFLKPKPPTPKVPDGFDPGFLNACDAIGRVRLRYSQLPVWTAVEQETLLQVALGEIPLSVHAVQQLWLSLAYDFKERLGAVDGSMSPPSAWITACICAFVNRRGIAIPAPLCFTSFFEELAFRA
jgi:hypothetical protein